MIPQAAAPAALVIPPLPHEVRSPFANSYHSPPPRQAVPHAVPQAQAHAPTIPGCKAHWMGDSRAINQKSESLKKWSGQAEDFKTWSEHLMDHMVKVHPEWKPALKYLSKTDEDLSFTRLRTEWLGPYKENGVDLAVKLEQLICDDMPERYYRRRIQLAIQRQ